MVVKQDYSYSLNKNQELIHVKNAQKGNEYFCPCCGEIMIPKQGTKNKWHFAHKGKLDECSYETYLHKVAKRRIRECFVGSHRFTISFYPKITCAVEECPLGNSQPCTWNTLKSFDIKKYYNNCDEEIPVDKFKADLLLTNTEKANIDPILIEIKVSHKSTKEKINSGYRIIEICIDSEEDINQIVSTATICESRIKSDWDHQTTEKIKFYNFKADTSELPDYEHQADKFRFWIDSRYYFHFDNPEDYNDSVKCLLPNPIDIQNSKFLIESNKPIRWDFAFQKLSQSGLGIKYCTMCKFYRMNYYGTLICILYKSKGISQRPKLSDAMRCPYFKQKDYMHDELIFQIDHNQECKITHK